MSREVLRAILKGDIEKLELLQHEGIDIAERTEKEGWNYLHRALLNARKPPSPEMIRYLLGLGLDANAIDIYGNIPLHYAARMRQPRLLEVLLEAGADVNCVNKDGVSPLRESLLRKPFDYESISLLLKSGADTEQKLEGGKSVREFVEVIAKDDDVLAELFKKSA